MKGDHDERFAEEGCGHLSCFGVDHGQLGRLLQEQVGRFGLRRQQEGLRTERQAELRKKGRL